MPADEISDDLAALLRDRATDDVPAAAAPHARPPAKPLRKEPRGHALTAALTGFTAGALGAIVGAFVAVTFLAVPGEAHAPPDPAMQPAPTLAALPPPPAPAPPSPRAVPPKSAPRTRAIPAPTTRGTPAAERPTERAWLDAARAALAQADFDGATRNLEAARARFPEGVLSEEREALAIHVLIGRGDRALAERARDTFLARHPTSPFALAIEEALPEGEATR